MSLMSFVLILVNRDHFVDIKLIGASGWFWLVDSEYRICLCMYLTRGHLMYCTGQFHET